MQALPEKNRRGTWLQTERAAHEAWGALQSIVSSGRLDSHENLAVLKPFVRTGPIWEGLKGLARYSDPQKQAMAISFSLGAFGVAVAVSTPLMAIFNPRIGRNRKSRTGPWQAGWMDPRDIAHMARNKTGLPLALHKGKLLRYVKNDAKGWRGGHHLVAVHDLKVH